LNTVSLQAGFDFGNGKQFILANRQNVLSLVESSNAKQKGTFVFRVDDMRKLPSHQTGKISCSK